MKYAKDLGLKTYNSIIQDIYDANPAVQMANGNEKEEQKYKQTKKNPTSRVLLKETLRLRNTSVLLLKQKEMIFRYEKERLSQLKVSLPPFDDDIDPNIICECPEEEEIDTSFNFPRLRFNIAKFFATVPAIQLQPQTQPQTQPETQPQGEGQRQPQGEGQRQPGGERQPQGEPPGIPGIPRRRPGPGFPRIPFPRLPPLFPPRIPGLAFNPGAILPALQRGGKFAVGLGVAGFGILWELLKGGNEVFNLTRNNTPKQPAFALAGLGNAFMSPANAGTYTMIRNQPQFYNNPVSPIGVTDVGDEFIQKRFKLNRIDVGNLTTTATKESGVVKIRLKGGFETTLPKGVKIPLREARQLSQFAEVSIDEFAKQVKLQGGLEVDGVKVKGGKVTVPKPKLQRAPIIPSTSTVKVQSTSQQVGKLLEGARDFRVTRSGIVGFGKNLIKGGPNIIANMGLSMGLEYLGKKYIVDPLTGPDGLLAHSLMRNKFYNKIDDMLARGKTPEEILARLEAFRDERIADATEKGEEAKFTPYINADFERARNYLMSHKAQRVGDVLDTELKTGPRGRIGAGTEYHIDTKFSKDLPMNRIIEMMDNLALSYKRRGRDIEFSNDAVAGQVYDPNASTEEKADLLRRAFAAHSHSMHSDFHSIDYYIPHTDKGRRDESAEGANILTPTVQGGQVNFGQGGGYGAYVTVTDSQGKVLTKTGHGDIRGARSGSISIPVKPVEKSDADPEPDLMSLFSPINKDTEVGVDPLLDFEQDLPFLVAPQIKTGSIQYVPVPMDLGAKVEYVIKDLHTPAWGNMSVIGG